MTISIVRLGDQRKPNEGIRIGTVRRPPRGVKKENYSNENWFDHWLPELAPSAELMKLGQQSQTDKDWQAFEKKYRRELSVPATMRLLTLLALLSKNSHFSVGCYCECESRCHRSILREVLKENGASIE